jgi:hypothetical protein
LSDPVTVSKPGLDRQTLYILAVAALVGAVALLGTFGGPALRARVPFTPENRIVGKWKGIETTFTGGEDPQIHAAEDLEFTSDGTLLKDDGQIGYYRFIDGNRLLTTLPQEGETLYRVSFTGDSLILRDGEEKIRFRRE